MGFMVAGTIGRPAPPRQWKSPAPDDRAAAWGGISGACGAAAGAEISRKNGHGMRRFHARGCRPLPPAPPPRIAMNRRRFLARSCSAAAALAVPVPVPALARAAGRGRLRLGMISDIHQDVMHDGLQRLGAFLEAMRAAKPGLIVQLGDFCKPVAANQPFLDLWNSWDGPRCHVIGNHD
jgi:hypothetical protein